MKSDFPRPGPEGQDVLSRQLAGLAGALRDDGIEPARDLWPSIAAAIDGRACAGGAAASARRRGGIWLTAALAATVLVMVGLGVTGRPAGPEGNPAASAADLPGSGVAGGDRAAPAAAPDGDRAPDRSGLRAVEGALAELQTALKESPDDPDLSRLILLIHHSRGRLLRLQADDGIRNMQRPGA